MSSPIYFSGEQALVVLPSNEWAQLLLTENGLVPFLENMGARITRGAVVYVEHPNLYRFSRWLLEHGLTWRTIPAYEIEQNRVLDEGDPITLIKRVLFDPMRFLNE